MVTISLRASELVSNLAKVTPCTSKEDTRPVLQTVFVELGVEANTLTLTAADGFRLGHVSMPYPVVEPCAFMLPMHAWQALLKVKHNTRIDPLITLEVDNDGGTFTVEGTEGTHSFHALGRFPDYRQIIPTQHKTTITPDMPAFESAVKCARIFARDGANVARVHISDSALLVEGKSEENGQSINEVPTAKDGQDLLIAFNCDFLVDMCKITKGESVTLYFGTPTTPARIEAGNFTGVIMPMHLEGGTRVPMTPADIRPAESYVDDKHTPASANTFKPREYCADHDYDTEAQKEPPAHYANYLNVTRMVSTPEDGAVETGLAIVDAKAEEPEGWGKRKPEHKVTLELTNPRSVVLPEQTLKSTKSERMTALNIERARIRREVHPSMRPAALRALYRAFGNAQRKHPAPVTAWDDSEAARRFERLILDRRQAHNITPALNQVAQPRAYVTPITPNM